MSENSEQINSPKNITQYLLSKTEEEFIESLQNEFNVYLAPHSRRNLHDLYNDLQTGETWFELSAYEEKELIRHTKVANIDVFYKTEDEKTFILQEDRRLTLPKGVSPQDYFEGITEPTRVQPQRKTNHSISERMHVSKTDEEEAKAGAARGVFEEIFDSSNFQIKGENIKDFITTNLQFNGITIATRSKDDKDNSYSGLKVIYHNHNFMLVIPEPDKPLFEFDSTKGYLNTFVWEEIPETEQITFVDENGIEQTRTVISENSPDILREVMICEQKKGKYNYELRTKILRISNGKIETYQAYTKNPLILDDEYRIRQELVVYLGHQNNWLPERIELHNRIIEEELAKVQKLSEALSEETPTIFMLRGNNGAGKSTLLKNHERFKKATKTNFEGIINTDTYDAYLRQESIVEGKRTLTPQQVHEEGNLLEKEIRRKALEQTSLSIIFDKRFSYKKQMDEIFEQAGNRNIEIFDLDVPLEVSAIRVLLRSTEEDAPIVGFDTLKQGFTGIRGLRDYLISIIKPDTRIVYYLLQDTSLLPPTKIAWKDNGVFLVDSRYYDKYIEFRQTTSEDALNQIGETIITERFIYKILATFPDEVKFEANKKLRNFLKKTIRQALEQAPKY